MVNVEIIASEAPLHPVYTWREDVPDWFKLGYQETVSTCVILGEEIPTWLQRAYKDAAAVPQRPDRGHVHNPLNRDKTNGTSRVTHPVVAKSDNIFQFELVFFLVENTIFTILKEWFMVDGSPFTDMFSLPIGDSMSPEGSSKLNPIILEQTSAVDFKALLLYFFHADAEKPPITFTGIKSWLGVLTLATRWNFSKVRQSVIDALDGYISNCGRPVMQTQLGIAYCVHSWVRNGLIALVSKVVAGKRDRTNITAPSPGTESLHLSALESSIADRIVITGTQVRISARDGIHPCKCFNTVVECGADHCRSCGKKYYIPPSRVAHEVGPLVDTVFAAELMISRYE